MCIITHYQGFVKGEEFFGLGDFNFYKSSQGFVKGEVFCFGYPYFYFCEPQTSGIWS